MLTIWRQIQNPTPDAPLFPTFNQHARPSEWIRADLKAAGLPTKDSEGRKIDFHSLRTSYISFLANSSAPMKVTQKLARHSTPTLTMNIYAKVFPEQERAALAGLPGADISANIFSLVGQRQAKPVKSAAVNDAKCERQRHVNGDYSGQLGGINDTGEKDRKSAFLSEKRGNSGMGRGGFEPPTHGFSVREIETLNTSQQSTCEIDTRAAAVNDAKSAHENPELQALIERWEALPEAVRQQIIELAGASDQKTP